MAATRNIPRLMGKPTEGMRVYQINTAGKGRPTTTPSKTRRFPFRASGKRKRR